MSEALLQAIWAAGQKIGISALLWALKKVDPRWLFAGFRYRARLTSKLIEMPFLFNDMNLNARDDYVALEVLTFQSGQFRAGTALRADYVGPMPKFNAHRRALIFGNGGFGKTTLLRNLALVSMKGYPFRKTFGKRCIVPVYVPLKVVKTSDPFPIMQALLTSDPYFTGRLGVRRLTRLARAGRLVVLLDGYDEMPYTGGFKHVQHELEHIFDRSYEFSAGAIVRQPNAFEKSKYSGAYDALRQARIYLASRLEFFDYNPITPAPDVQRWMLRGLDDRRIELVERIFAKYRTRTASSTGRDLNAELFLQELMRTGDQAVLDLGKSPLFLTVMCYVYASQYAQAMSTSIFSLGVSDLSKTCIKLLIQDLDTYKSRHADLAERQAILNRRAAYPEEKYEFLTHFAVALYEKEMSFFDEQCIVEVARTYFKEASGSLLASEISRGLDRADASANLVKQLILSGIFVLVDKREGVRLFDFPHRKFRESLAVEYFSANGGVEQLLLLVGERRYSELVLAFVDQSPRRNEVVDRVIALLSVEAAPHLPALFADVLRRLPTRTDAEAAFMKLLDALETWPHRQLPLAILDFVPRGPEPWRAVRLQLERCVHSGEPALLRRWAMIAARCNLPAARVLVEDELCSRLDRNALLALLPTALVEGVQSTVVARYLMLSIAENLQEQGVANLIHWLYVGQSDQKRASFKEWLQASSPGLALPLRERVVAFCCGVREKEEDLISDSRADNPLAFA